MKLTRILTFLKDLKVKTKVILLILLVSYISIFFVSITIYIIGTRALSEQIQKELSTTAEHVLDSVNKMIYERQTDLQLMVNDSVLSSSDTKNEEKTEILKNMLFYLGLYDELHLTDTKGEIIASTRKNAFGGNVHENAWYKQTLDTFLYVSDVIPSQFTKKNTLIIANTVFDKEKNLLGVLFGEFSWEVIMDILFHTQEHLEIFLLDQERNIIAQKVTSGEKKYENIQEIINPKKEKENIILEIPSQGFQGFTGNNWSLVVQTPKEIVFAPIQNFTMFIWLIVLIISALAPIIGHLFTKRFVKPINNLLEGVSKIEKGIYNERIQIESKDEFGCLAKNFNNMTNSLLEKTNTLLTEKGKYKSILESTRSGIVLFDKKNQLIAYNKGFLKIFSFSEKDMSHTFASSVFSQIKKSVIESASLKAFVKIEALISHNNFRSEKEFEIICSKEKYKILEIYTRPVLTENETLLGRIWVFTDVTEERDAEKTKNDFISVASHKIRTPLTALNWTLQMFKDHSLGKTTPEQKEILRQLEIHTLRLDSLVKILMNAAEIKKNKMPVHKSVFNLKGTLERLYENIMKKTCDMKSVTYKIPSKEELEKYKILADKEKIQQVLKILLENACIYSKNTKPKVIVEIKISPEKRKIIISVSDNGIGIPLSEQGKIFTKFFRGKDAITKNTEGIGLSLYLAKIILDSHKEKIWFESAEHIGSTFFFTLPLGTNTEETSKK